MDHRTRTTIDAGPARRARDAGRRDPSAVRGRDRRRGLRAHRGLPALPHPRRHPVRGRGPARRPRAHPRRRRLGRPAARRRQRVHRPQRRAPTPGCASCSRELDVRGPAHRDEHERPLRGLRAGVRRRPRAARPVRPAAPPLDPRLPPHARGRSSASTGARSAFLRTTDDEDETHATASSWRSEGFSDYFIAHYAIPVVSCVWSAGAGDAAGLPGALPVPVPRPPRDAPGQRARRSGTPSSADRAPTSSGCAELLTDVARRPCRHRRHPASDGVEVRDVDRTGHATSTASSSRPTPTRRSACSPTRPTTRSRRSEQFGYSAQRDGPAHRQLGPAAAPRRPGLVELPDGVLRPARPADASVTLLDEPPAGTRRRRRTSSSPSTTRDRIDPDRVIASMDYEHPIYTAESVRGAAAADRPRHRPHRRTPAPTTAGASTRTAAAPASRPPRHFGVDLVTATPPDRRAADALPRACARTARVSAQPARSGPPRLPAPRLPVAGRPRPMPRASRPFLRPFARFERARPPRRPAPADQGQHRALPGTARHRRSATAAGCSCWPTPASSGHVFDPLSVFWCYDADGALALRRRRGAQHLRRAARLPRCGPTRRAAPQADKEFYVSPFFDVDGRYRCGSRPRRRTASRPWRCGRDGAHAVHRHRPRPPAPARDAHCSLRRRAAAPHDPARQRADPAARHLALAARPAPSSPRPRRTDRIETA